MTSASDRDRPARIGVFGGTFDPIHVGHLLIAQDVHEALALDTTLFVPAGTPPHRPDGARLGADARLRLVESAVADDARFLVFDGEVLRPGPSYTVDTLESLHASRPDAELFLLMGRDQYEVFDRWHRPSRILELATLVVVERGGGGSGAELATDGGAPHVSVETRRIDVSSTEVRRRLGQGSSVRYLVTEAVRRIIEDNDWYKSG